MRFVIVRRKLSILSKQKGSRSPIQRIRKWRQNLNRPSTANAPTFAEGHRRIKRRCVRHVKQLVSTVAKSVTLTHFINLFTTGGSHDSDNYVLIGSTDPKQYLLITLYYKIVSFLFRHNYYYFNWLRLYWGQNKLIVLVLDVVCRSTTSVDAIGKHSKPDVVFLEEVTKNDDPWASTVVIEAMGTQCRTEVCFKLDTGADVGAIHATEKRLAEIRATQLEDDVCDRLCATVWRVGPATHPCHRCWGRTGKCRAIWRSRSGYSSGGQTRNPDMHATGNAGLVAWMPMLSGVVPSLLSGGPDSVGNWRSWCAGARHAP